jgi:hypothetical protein
LRERREARLIHGIVLVAPHEHADASHPVALLRPCPNRPRRRTPEPCDERGRIGRRDLSAAQPGLGKSLFSRTMSAPGGRRHTSRRMRVGF